VFIVSAAIDELQQTWIIIRKQ